MKSNQNYQNISNELDDIFRRNLRMLLSACGWTQMSFSEDMPRKTISLGRSSVNKILNGKQRVSAAFLLGCCDYFKIPVHEMVSLEFNPEKYINAGRKYRRINMETMWIFVFHMVFSCSQNLHKKIENTLDKAL